MTHFSGARLALGLAALSLAASAAPALGAQCTDCDPDPGGATSNGAPVAGLAVSASTVVRGQPVTLSNDSSDPDGDPLSVSWDLDGDGQYGESAGQDVTSVSFSTLGEHTVGIRVSDAIAAAKTATAKISVVNRGATAGVSSSEWSAPTGTPITFNANAWDPDGDAVTVSWNVDGDDDTFGDATGPSVTRSWAKAGRYTVAALVRDAFGAGMVSARSITVENRRPTAKLAIGPAAPVAGDTVTFDSAGSVDPDGTITRRWDLDGDGAFDDGDQPTASRIYASAGTFKAKLRIQDDNGAVEEVEKTFTVAAKPAPGSGTDTGTDSGTGGDTGAPAPQTPSVADQQQDRQPGPVVDPPVVRPQRVAVTITASFKRAGAKTRVRRFVIGAPPAGATVKVTCSGGGCPKRLGASGNLAKRFKQALEAGARVTVTVAKPGAVGQVTTYTIVKRKAPRRTVA
jgi:hypothetical protein